MTHSELIAHGVAWLKRTKGQPWSVSHVVTEIHTTLSEQPDIFGFRSGSSTVIECKVSHSDFTKNKNKKFVGLGDYRFFLVPEGLLNIYEKSYMSSDLADGLLEIDENNKIKMIIVPGKQQKDFVAEQIIYNSIISRLSNHAFEIELEKSKTLKGKSK